MSSVDDWEAQKLKHNENKGTLVLQIGAPWCKHCAPVKTQFESFDDKYTFTFLYSDASDSELTDHFECSKLPAVIVYTPTDQQTFMTESVRIDMVEYILKRYCSPKLVLTEDF